MENQTPETSMADGSQSTITQPLVVDSKPKSNNFLIILLSILLLISIIVAVFFVSQTQRLVSELKNLKNQTLFTPTPSSEIDLTIDWKTYTNSDYGFSMKYPKDWSLKSPEISNNFEGSDVIDMYSLQNGPVTLHLEVHSVDNTTYNLQLESIKNFDWDNMTLQNINVDGVQGQLLTGTVNNKPKRVAIFASSKYIFILSTVVLDDLQNLNDILSTFKFNDEYVVIEEKEVRTFAELFAKTYMMGDWIKLKTLLTSSAAKEMSENETSLSKEKFFDSYKVLSVEKQTSPGQYKVTIQFIKDGEPYRNPSGDPQILVLKETGTFKSNSWYLYQ